MAQELAYSYAALIKSEKQEDGTLKVYGKATDDSIDIDKQICDETWLKRAMPDWFETGGNIREQHSNIAAGVATEYEAKSDVHYITALVVDAASVKKVETGVLKGFSIGIRSPRVIRDEKAAGGRIVDGQIVEVSLVDRPANPNAKLMLAKAADSGELMAVTQTNIPSPAELFAKNAEPEAAEVEAAPVEEVAEVATEEVAPELAAEPSEIVEAAKSLLAALNKYDQAGYEAAIGAIADLIIVEANEMKAGSDERESIKELLGAAKHLAHWYQGEVAAGEVAGEVAAVEEALYMSADSEKADDEESDDEECKMCGKAADECKCADKSADAEDPAEEAAPTEPVAEPVEEELTVDEDTEKAIIAKAVSAAEAAVSEEVAKLRSALEAEAAKATKLEADLEVAKSAAVSGGPKRSITKAADAALANEYLVKAASYSQKAATTEDKTLAAGYRELAEDFKLKAATAARKES
jgi:hypothetical protein